MDNSDPITDTASWFIFSFIIQKNLLNLGEHKVDKKLCMFFQPCSNCLTLCQEHNIMEQRVKNMDWTKFNHPERDTILIWFLSITFFFFCFPYLSMFCSALILSKIMWFITVLYFRSCLNEIIQHIALFYCVSISASHFLHIA